MIKNNHHNPSTLNKQSQISKWDIHKRIWLLVVSFCAFATKFYRLDRPSQTAFDEVHFGKYASYYLKREYFFDVHPPLGKLLFAAIGYIFGYDGSFSFENIGLSYVGTNVPYVEMRSLSALCGTLTIIAIYAMLIEMRFSLPVALIGACMVAFDNGLTTQSRFILLDAQLIFFIIMTCFCWVKFRSLTSVPFTLRWWAWLSATGLFIGLALGVKFIGLFVTATIGICTIRDLWDVSSTRKSKHHMTAVYHLIARSLCLIILPIIVFMIPYWVHFKVLNRSGDGATFMSTEFQATLKENNITSDIKPVYYGSIVKIMNVAHKTYLHSHRQTYPLQHSDGKISSQGQQVTGYPHADENNDWMILPVIADTPIDYKNNSRKIVKDGDIVRLLHISTRKYLLTHDVASPLTFTNQEVTAIDAENSTSQRYSETLWKIEIKTGGDQLKSIVSEFHLKHQDTRCNLLTARDNLPNWGFGQLEVNAARLENQQTTWTIDKVTPQGGWTENDDDRLLDSGIYIKPSFFQKFFELITRSLEHNSKLVDDSPYNTHPIKWPFMIRGMSFWISNDDREKIFLLGNPFAWYISILSVPFFVGLMLVDLFMQRREKQFLSQQQRSFLYSKGCFFFICYLLNYIPFFCMGRALYFHHYLPCYLLNSLVFTSLYQLLALRYRILENRVVVGIVCGLIIGMFLHFSCLSYGTNHHQEYFKLLKWLDTWHFTK